jgi:hypothetical protein
VRLIKAARASYEASWAALSVVGGLLTWDAGLYPLTVACAVGGLHFGWVIIQCLRDDGWIDDLGQPEAGHYAMRAAAFGISALLGTVVTMPLDMEIIFLWAGISAAALFSELRRGTSHEHRTPRRADLEKG